MRLPDFLPALGLSLAIVIILAATRLWPGGDGPVLVRLGEAGLEGLLGRPALADAALVALPAPGFAVLRGDAARIRAAYPAAIAWKDDTTCSPNP